MLVNKKDEHNKFKYNLSDFKEKLPNLYTYIKKHQANNIESDSENNESYLD